MQTQSEQQGFDYGLEWTSENEDVTLDSASIDYSASSTTSIGAISTSDLEDTAPAIGPAWTCVY